MGLLVLAALGLVGGCAAEPFPPEPRPPLDHPNPAALAADFGRRVPARFLSDDTVVITSWVQDMAVLAVLRLDRPGRTFELLGLNHVGVQLFLLAGEGDKTEVRFAVGPLADQKEVLESIAQDVRRMYFDLTPGPAAVAEIHSNDVAFTDEQAGGTIEYEFGGPQRVLLEKRAPSWIGSVWKVRYFQYTAGPGGLFPRGMVLDNERYHYRIVVKNRSWQVE